MNTYDASHNPDGRDPVAELLSQTLSEEAAMVEPTPGSLQSIQQRTKPKSRARDPWVLGAFGAGLATATVITAIVVVGTNGNDPSGAPPAASNSTGEPTGTTVEQAGFHQGVYDPSADPANQFTVYFVGPDPKNPELSPRLFSETHTVTDPGSDPQLAAVHELLTSTPIDTDYRNPWPEGVDISAITENGNMASFDLVSSGDAPDFWADESTRDLALQAMARTAGLTDGAFGYSINGSSDDVGYSVQPDDQVRAWLTIDNIVEGQTVSSPVAVTISGNVFEGNVNWQLLDSGGAIADEGFVTTSQGMWTQADIDLGTLEPGTYTIKVIEYSMEDGSIHNFDDKTFTIE